MDENTKDIKVLQDLTIKLSGECQRLLYGKCTSLFCLQRGGWVRGTMPVDYNKATCEQYEQSNALRRVIRLLEKKESNHD